MNPDVEWSTREKLAIASYVFHSGDQHWTGNVSRVLRPLGDPDRPTDWFSPKHCAQQYTALTEAAESTRKRPERSDSNDAISSTLQVPTPSVNELVLRKVTQERIEELKKLIRNEKAQYKKISQTVEQIESGKLNDKIDEMYEDMQKQIEHDEEAKQTLLSTEPSTTSTDKVDESIPQPTASIPAPAEALESVCKPSNEAVVLPTIDEAKSNPSEATSSQTLMVCETKQEDAIDVPPKQQVPEEKERSASPATSSSQTIPTPKPVIESDSSDEECDIVQCPPEVESILTKISRQEGFETEQPSPTLVAVEKDAVMVESSEAESTITSSQQKTPETADTNTLETPVESAEPISQSSLGVTETESTFKSELSKSVPMESEQKIVTTDISNKTASQTIIEPETKELTQSSLEESMTQDVNSSQDKTAIITPDVSVIEGTVPVLQKTVDHERTEEESYDFGSNVSGSQAYFESYPSSPALSTTSDADPEVTAQHRAWKKSIVILWKQVASHRYASLFLHPVTNEIAPNYSSIVLRPMDLSTLKRNVENGVVRTTSEFQRDLMLMFQNALMYNNCEHDVYKMTQDMQKDVMDQVEQFLGTQLMMETTKQQISSKGLRRSTLRKSIVTEKASKRTTDDSKPSKK